MFIYLFCTRKTGTLVISLLPLQELLQLISGSAGEWYIYKIKEIRYLFIYFALVRLDLHSQVHNPHVHTDTVMHMYTGIKVCTYTLSDALELSQGTRSKDLKVHV